jgi:hypothetical protein
MSYRLEQLELEFKSNWKKKLGLRNMQEKLENVISKKKIVE